MGVEAIAERAGVTKKTLYDRFGNKERLVVEYLSARDRRWRDLLAERLGLNLRIVHPDREQIEARDATNLRWSYDPDGCCEIRKVLPLEKAMAPFDASITGRKAHQASTRNALPRFEDDGTTAVAV